MIMMTKIIIIITIVIIPVAGDARREAVAARPTRQTRADYELFFITLSHESFLFFIMIMNMQNPQLV